MKKLLHKIGSVILLGVFCIYITPRDYLHHFVDHEDTHDEDCRATSPHGLTISTIHKHCEWLNWTLEAYMESPTIGLPSIPHTYQTLMQELPAHHYSYPAYFFSLRAPPPASA